MEEIEEKLTLEECSTIIENCYKQKNIKVKSRSVVSLSNSVEGFLGQHFLVDIEHDEVDNQQHQRFFMKILNGSFKTIFDIAMSINSYEKELFFYETVFRDFQAFNLDTSFAPKQYFAKQYLFVLEDLTVRDFKPCSKDKFLDLSHCKAALSSVVKFHSTYLLYEKAKSLALSAPYCLDKLYPDLLQGAFSSASNSAAKIWLGYTLEGILAIIDILSEDRIANEAFAQKIREYLEEAQNLKDESEKNILLHSDLWLNNFLFKYSENDVPVEAVIIDYQLIKFGPPCLDVMHTLYDNTRKSFRDKHFDELLDFYYESLKEKLGSCYLDEVLPKTEFLRLCEKYKTITKLLCLFDRTIIFMPESLTNSYFTSDEDVRRFFFQDRAKLILEAFNTDSAFRELLKEDLLELRSMLLPAK